MSNASIKPDLREIPDFSNPTMSPLHNGQGVVKVNIAGLKALVKKGLLSEEQGKKIMEGLDPNQKENNLFVIVFRKVDGKMQPVRALGGNVVIDNGDNQRYFRAFNTLNLEQPESIPQRLPEPIIVQPDMLDLPGKSPSKRVGLEQLLDTLDEMKDKLAHQQNPMGKAIADAKNPHYIPATAPDYSGLPTANAGKSAKGSLAV